MKIIIWASLVIPFCLGACQMQGGISLKQKRNFIDLVKELPAGSGGEIYTADAITQANPYLPVLLALDDVDVGMEDIYPFIALSRGLCDQAQNRDYVIRNFSEIRHPVLKLVWGVMLFDAGSASPGIVQFLKNSLKSKKQSQILSEALGDDFSDLQKRLGAERPRSAKRLIGY